MGISGPKKKKPKSTTHIDPQVGTGGRIRLAAEVLAVHIFIKMARKYRHLLAVCLAKARNDM